MASQTSDFFRFLFLTATLLFNLKSGGTERESLLKFRKLQMDKQLTDFEESQRLRGIETQEYIQKVRKSLMMKQSDPLTLLMAMRIGRVNHERSKQIEMKKMLEDHDRKVEEAFNEKVIREAEDEKREKEEEKRIRKEKEMQHGKLLMQQWVVASTQHSFLNKNIYITFPYNLVIC